MVLTLATRFELWPAGEFAKVLAASGKDGQGRQGGGHRLGGSRWSWTLETLQESGIRHPPRFRFFRKVRWGRYQLEFFSLQKLVFTNLYPAPGKGSYRRLKEGKHNTTTII